MLIDELIELSKHVKSKEAFLQYQHEIEKLSEEEKTATLKFLKQHNFNKNYLHILLNTRVFANMSNNLAFINKIVDDENIERVIDILESNENLYEIRPLNWMIKIFAYIKDSNYNDDLLSLIEKYFSIGSDEEAYNEAVAVLDVIQKLNYSETIINYFDARYGVDNIGVDSDTIDSITMLSDDFDAELFEKQDCIKFYQDRDFAEIDLLTQRYIFNKIKNLSDEQKEDKRFLANLDDFLITQRLIDNLDDEDFTSVIDCYISLYDAMKEKNSFSNIFDYVNGELVDNGIFQADSINALMRLYNKHIENDTILEVLQDKDVIDNSDGKTLEIMINTIENLDEDSLPIKKGEIYYTIMQGCEKIKSNPNELFLLIASYDYNPEVLNFICKSNFTTMEEVRGLLNDITITTLKEEMDKCSDINEITNYLMFLKENMNDTETLDLTPKSMVKKREYCNLKMKDDSTAPVDKIKN